MFDNKDKQLADLETAYVAFMETTRDLSLQDFLKPLGDWNSRDIAAHFIGWNRITLAGGSALREGAEPFYFYDGTNDYRRINGRFLMQFSSIERDELLKEIASTKDILVMYLKTISEDEWELNTGIVHYRAGPATVARCVDSLVRDYQKHRQEIVDGLDSD